MRKFSFLKTAAGIVLFSISISCVAAEQATINVNANGNIEVMPDYINVFVNIEKTKKTKADAKAEVDRITQQVLDVAKKLNIKDKHVQASDIFARPEYQWKPDNKRIHIGEVVTRNVSIKLYVLDSYSALAAELMKLDITNFNQNGFGYDNIEEHQNKALVSALNKAKTKAELIAGTLGVKLGSAWQVSESGGDFPIPMYAKAMRGEMAMMDGAPQEAPLEVKAQTITTNVNVSFLIAP